MVACANLCAYIFYAQGSQPSSIVHVIDFNLHATHLSQVHVNVMSLETLSYISKIIHKN